MSFVHHSPMADRERRRRRIVRIVGPLVLVIVLIVAALLWPRATRGALSVSGAATVAPTGALQGELAASRTGNRVCYSLSAKGTTAVLRFVPGWSADAVLDLRDPSGAVVGQPGDTLLILGAPSTVGTVAGCTQHGRIWTVTSVRKRIAG